MSKAGQQMIEAVREMHAATMEAKSRIGEEEWFRLSPEERLKEAGFKITRAAGKATVSKAPDGLLTLTQWCALVDAEERGGWLPGNVRRNTERVLRRRGLVDGFTPKLTEKGREYIAAAPQNSGRAA